MKRILLSFILCICMGYIAQAQVNESDSLELVRFYEATGGDDWFNNSGWLVSPVKDWYGIELSSNEKRVKGIFFYQKNLIGELIDLNLPELEYLSITSNQLSGGIPDFTLPKLKNLDLSSNQLSGDIPDFTDLQELYYLNLSSNQLSEGIPDFTGLPELNHFSITV